MGIRAVLFDAVGTLFHSRGSVGEIYQGVARRYGIEAETATLQREFVRLTTPAGTPIAKHDWKALVREVFRSAGPFPRFDAFFEEVYDIFRSNRAWHCYPETREVLERLRQGGFRMGVVSNFDARLGGVLEDLGIEAYFDAVVTPDSAGQAKPDSRIFIEAAVRVGVEPPEALFVGDDFLQDYEPAARAGFRSVLVDRHGNAGLDPRHTVADLAGILPILGIPRSS